MNRGNIPGYYYDEEKKKYFKIQANHIAPAKAKYSKSNVKQEQRRKREIKRRKVQEGHALKQTVKRATVLKHPLLTGYGIQREHGTQPLVSYRTARDDAFVQGLESTHLSLHIQGFGFTGVTDAQRLPNDMTLLAVTHARGSHAVYLCDFFHDDVVPEKTLYPQRPIVAFPEKIVSMECTSISSSPYLLAGGNQFSSAYFYFSSLDIDSSVSTFPVTELRSIRTLWASKMNPWSPQAAFTGNGAVVLTSVEKPQLEIGTLILDDKDESFALDWLSRNVLAFGVTEEPSDRHFRHAAYLWDVRIDMKGPVKLTTARIERPQRITGMKRLGDSGHHLIVTSSRDINLYDLRMLSRDSPPLLAIPHTSGSSQLVFDVQEQILAAADEYSKVAVYSLRTGKRLATLSDYTRGQGSMQSLRWQQSNTGTPYLQACFGDSYLERWAWGTWL